MSASPVTPDAGPTRPASPVTPDAGPTRPASPVAPDAGTGLTLTPDQWAAMVAHCLAAYPEEGCGLLGGDPHSGQVGTVFPTANAAASARVYTVDPRDHLRADRAAEDAGQSIIGVFHSHTHTDAYPSDTDTRQAPDPTWHYVLVSLRDTHPVVRSYRVVDGTVAEEVVRLVPPAG